MGSQDCDESNFLVFLKELISEAIWRLLFTSKKSLSKRQINNNVIARLEAISLDWSDRLFTQTLCDQIQFDESFHHTSFQIPHHNFEVFPHD